MPLPDDREHIVSLNAADKAALIAWLQGGSGAFRPRSSGNRVTFESVENGGIWVRTRPWQYTPSPPPAWNKD